jgi:hypothetical protein
MNIELCTVENRLTIALNFKLTLFAFQCKHHESCLFMRFDNSTVENVAEFSKLRLKLNLFFM